MLLFFNLHTTVPDLCNTTHQTSMHTRRHQNPTTMRNNSHLQHLDSHSQTTNPTPIKSHEPLKHSQIMEKFKATLFKLANSNPNNPLNPSQIALIEKRLDAFSSVKTPTHPPYSAMIEETVKKLDSEGSLTTEIIISEYIKKTYEGLPWAHDRYFKHHLGKLCESGELECDIDGSYIIPGQKKPRCSRRQGLKRRLLGRKKEDMVEDGNLGREEVNDLSDSQVGCQEEASQGLGRGKRKRKRSYVFEDEEDEVVETRVAVRQGNMDSGSEMAVIETQNEVLLLNSGEVKCKSNETQNEDHGHAGISEGKYELHLDIECGKEVKNHVVEVDCELFEGTKEPESVLPGNVMKILPEDEAMQLDVSHGSNLMGVPVENVNESNLVRDQHQDSSGGLMLVPVIESDATESTVEKSVLKKITPNFSARDLMIVPYMDNQVNPAVRKEMIPLSKSVDPTIVCGLTAINEELTKPKKKLQVYQQRKRSKPPQEKPKALRDELMLAALDSTVQTSLQTKLKRKSQQPPKSKGVTLLEDGFVKQLQGSKSSHSINLENISIEDEEPLCQVMEKCGNLKRHGMQGAKLKVASLLASSKVGAQLPKELPSLEKFAEMTPRAEKESALTKRTEKPLHMEHGSQDKKQHGVEHQREDNGGHSKKKLRHHVPEVPVEAFVNEKLPVLDQLPRKQNKVGQESRVKLIEATPEHEKEKQLHSQIRSGDKSQHEHHPMEDNDVKSQHKVKHVALELLEVAYQLPQKPNKVDQESSLKLIEATLENEKEKQLHRRLRSQEKSQHEVEHQMEDNDRQSRQVRHHVLELPVVALVNEKLPVVDQLPQKRNKVDQESPQTVIKATPENKKKKQLHRQLRSQDKSQYEVELQREVNVGKSQQEVRLDALEQLEVKASVNGKVPVVDQLPEKQNEVDVESPLKFIEATPEKKAYLSDMQNQHPDQLQLENSQPKKRGRGRPRKSEKATKTKTILSLELVSDSTNLQLQKSQTNKKSVKQGGQSLENVRRGRSEKVEEPPKEPMDLFTKYQLEKQGDLDPQNNHLSKDETIVFNLPQQQGLSEPATRPRGRPPKVKSEVTEEHLRASLKLDKQQEVGLSEQVNNQESQKKKLKRGRPKIQKGGDKDDDHDFETLERGAAKSGAGPSKLQCQEQGGLKSASHAILEASLRQNEVDLTESRIETSDITRPNFELSEITTSEASSQRDNDESQPRRRITRSSEAAKTLLESQNGIQHDVELSGQRRLAKLTPAFVPLDHHCPDRESEDSENEVQVKTQRHKDQKQEKSHEHDQASEKIEVQARESLSATSDHISPPDLGLSPMTTSEASTCLADKSSQRHKDLNQPRRMSTRSSEAAKTLLESQNGKRHDPELSDQRRPAKLTVALVPSDHHCPDKSGDSETEDQGKPVELEQPEESHDCDQTRKKMEVQVNLPKEMSAKNVFIQVPLSSKDQLRSRMKRQSQDA